MRTMTLAPVELYVRSLSAESVRDRQEWVLDSLESLKSRDVIASYRVHVIGTEFARNSVAVRTHTGQMIRHRLITVRHWAMVNGMTCKPAMGSRDVTQLADMHTYEVTSLPEMMLVEYDDDHIKFVTPVSFLGHNYSVSDHVKAIDPESDVKIPGREITKQVLDPVRRCCRLEEQHAADTDADTASVRDQGSHKIA